MSRTTDLVKQAYGRNFRGEVFKADYLTGWQRLFIADAFFISGKSKDTSTKCGAVIVSPDHDIVSRGWNDHPRGVMDFEIRRQRPEKYIWTEHAERNAIYNAARLGVSTKGASIFITRLPCPDCARAIRQAGVRTVYACVAEDEVGFAARQNVNASLEMLHECMVGINVLPVEVYNFYDKRRYEAFSTTTA